MLGLRKKRIIRCGNELRFHMPLPNPEGDTVIYPVYLSDGRTVHFTLHAGQEGPDPYFTVRVYPNTFDYCRDGVFSWSEERVASFLIEKVVASAIWGKLTHSNPAPMPKIVKRKSLKPAL